MPTPGEAVRWADAGWGSFGLGYCVDGRKTGRFLSLLCGLLLMVLPWLFRRSQVPGLLGVDRVPLACRGSLQVGKSGSKA